MLLVGCLMRRFLRQVPSLGRGSIGRCLHRGYVGFVVGGGGSSSGVGGRLTSGYSGWVELLH